MLERHEQQALAAIEARLRSDDPGLHRALTGLELPAERRTAGPLLRTLAAVLLAVAATALTTALVGPDAGGLVAVLALSAAGMYGWQALQVCGGSHC